MSSNVTLRTEGGWNHTTTLDDPIFSDILAPYLELDEMPKEVILKGSVAELIEENWHWWFDVKKIIDDLTNAKNRFVIDYTPSVMQFATILNLPPEWKLFLAVGPDDLDYNTLVRHYEDVGRIMEQHKLNIVDLSFDDVSKEVFKDLLLYCNTHRSDSLLRGIARTASARYLRSQGTLALSCVDWDTFLNEIRLEHIEYRDIVINSIKIIQGCGDVRGATTYMPYELYSKIIANIRDYSSISLDEYGLGFLIGVDGGYSSASPLGAVARLHQEVLNIHGGIYFIGMNYNSDIGMDKFYELSEKFMQHIGMEGMIIMREILHHQHTYNPPYTPSHRRRLTVFLAFIEEQIEKNSYSNNGYQY